MIPRLAFGQLVSLIWRIFDTPAVHNISAQILCCTYAHPCLLLYFFLSSRRVITNSRAEEEEEEETNCRIIIGCSCAATDQKSPSCCNQFYIRRSSLPPCTIRYDSDRPLYSHRIEYVTKQWQFIFGASKIVIDWSKVVEYINDTWH